MCYNLKDSTISWLFFNQYKFVKIRKKVKWHLDNFQLLGAIFQLSIMFFRGFFYFRWIPCFSGFLTTTFVIQNYRSPVTIMQIFTGIPRTENPIWIWGRRFAGRNYRDISWKQGLLKQCSFYLLCLIRLNGGRIYVLRITDLLGGTTTPFSHLQKSYFWMW